MTTFDFAPLFRTAIGFDRLARLMDTAASSTDASSYPPYNIQKTGDDTYRLTMAVAGFKPEDLELVAKENTLVVSGKVNSEGQKGEMLYRGIAGRDRFDIEFAQPIAHRITAPLVEAELVDALFPQPKLAAIGVDAGNAVIADLDRALVVGNKRIALFAKRGGQGGFARAGLPTKQHCLAADQHRAGMEDDMIALVEQHAEHATRQEYRHILQFGIVLSLEGDRMSAFQQKARDMRNTHQETPVGALPGWTDRARAVE